MKRDDTTSSKMRPFSLARGFATLCAVLATMPGSNALAAPAETVLHAFGGGADGAIPRAGLVIDSNGDLYGTSAFGGASGNGTVFKLSRPAVPNGVWTETVLHTFTGADGAQPLADLIIDRSGNLVGTTVNGGTFNKGVLFRLTPGGIETVLYSFNGNQGESPGAGMIADDKGNLYGTASGGGSFNKGVVFKLSPAGVETVLHSFNGSDGATPLASLIADSNGNLYGTTQYGGKFGFGVVFKLAPPAVAGGPWTYSLVHEFAGSPTDGNGPSGRLVIGDGGVLYGTTSAGGGACRHVLTGCGIVFKLAPPSAAGRRWTETVLHAFSGWPRDGMFPFAGLIMDSKGDLYGTTLGGGVSANGSGTVFKLSRSAGRPWPETVLYSFGDPTTDGATPLASLIADGNGNLLGTTSKGGQHGWGTVFQLSGAGFVEKP